MDFLNIQAGLLTPGVFLLIPAFPPRDSGFSGIFVAGYSGGTVSDFHGLPF